MIQNRQKSRLERQVEKFYTSGLTAFDCENYELAIKNFEECNNLLPNYMKAKAWILFCSILSGNSEKAFDLFGELYEKMENYRQTLRYRLFLMDEIFGCVPIEYRHILKEAESVEKVNISLSALEEKLKGKPKEQIDREMSIAKKINVIRHAALCRSYPHAISLVKELMSLRETPKRADQVEMLLLQKAAEKSKERREDYTSYIKDENYTQFEQLLSDRISNHHSYSRLEEYLYKLYDQFSKIKNGEIPDVKKENSKDFFESIDNNDFIAAIKYDREFSRERYHDVTQHPMYLLLNKVVIEMISVSMESGVAGVDTFDLIDKYLDAIEKPEYKNIIRQLIIIGIQKGNMDSVIEALNNIHLEEYHLNVDSLINLFDIAIFEKNIIMARAYLNILKSNEAFVQNKSAETLSTILSESEKLAPEKSEFARIYEQLMANRGAIIVDLNKTQNSDALCAEANNHRDVVVTLNNNMMIVRYQAQPWSNKRLTRLEENTRYYNVIRHNNQSIESGLLLIEHSRAVKPHIYNYLGEAYFGKEKFDLALNYFKIYLSYENIPQEMRKKANAYAKYIENTLNAQQEKTEGPEKRKVSSHMNQLNQRDANE